MKFLSMFSGIEAASVAWKPLGWEAAAVCEIDPFASAVLAHHYPNVPNLGNVQEADFDAIGPVDLAVFGSPCQSFSIAGKRLGLDDPRGNLALVGASVVYRKRPRWFVFENVPGILSSDSGWDFGTLLAAFAGYPPGSVFEPPSDGWRNSGTVRESAPDGYGLAWRVLDAQYIRVDGFARAVPQRRRRVFVVGYLGDWRRAAAVLFERESLLGNPAPRRQAGKTTAPTLAARTRGGGGLGTDFDCDGGLIPDVSKALAASRGAACANADDLETYLPIAFGGNNQSGPIDVATAQTAHGGTGRIDFESETFVAHALRVPVAAMPLLEIGKGSSSRGDGPNGAGFGDFGDPMFTLQAGAQHGVAIAFDARQSDVIQCGDKTGPLDTDGSTMGILHNWRVRRLTPVECERLQGFPDGYTAIPYRGKQSADGPRYKALGNSFAVNVVGWIGQRIDMVDRIEGRQ